ncbi:MAG: ATP-binding protein [Bacteroidales bacterium]|jgi:predicted HTH transcriptional regulator|nr:ATP-binding protein [Bacteroidales bacterium]
MSAYIYDLIRQGEHLQLDFKHSITDSKKIARSLAAFANTTGGKLLVGVRDNGSIAGVKSDEEFYMIQAAADLYCNPQVTFKTKVWEIEGKTLLEITIPPMDTNQLITAPNKEGKSRVYIRVNDQNFIVNHIYLKAWKKKKFGKGVLVRYAEPEKILFDYLQRNPVITFSRFMRLAGLSKVKTEKILVNLVVLEIIEIVFTENQIFYQLAKNGIVLE